MKDTSIISPIVSGVSSCSSCVACGWEWRGVPIVVR